MLCAVYSSPQETSKHIILWSDTETKTRKKGASTIWQLRKVERKQPKRVAQRRAAPRRAEPRRPPRRDSSVQHGTATFHWRTYQTQGLRDLSKGTTNTSSEVRRSFSFYFQCQLTLMLS